MVTFRTSVLWDNHKKQLFDEKRRKRYWLFECTNITDNL